MRLAVLIILTVFGFSLHTASIAAEKKKPSTSKASDLLNLYHESLLRDPRVISSHANTAASQERQREAFGGLLPKISATSALNRTRYNNGQTADIYNNERYLLNLTQYIYNKPAWENYKKFKSLAGQGEFEAVDAQSEAAIDLAQRYFTALAAEDELELVIAERRTTQKNMDRVNALFSKKMAMITDVLDLRARVDSLTAQELEARNQVLLSREAISEIVGRPIHESLSRIRNDITPSRPEESLETWLERAVAANSAIKARQKAVDAANAALREGKGGHYPSLSLDISAQRSDVGYSNALTPRTDSYVASIGIQVPIYSGGSTSARIRALYNDQIDSEQKLESMRRKVIKETTSAYLTTQSSTEKIRASRNALESAEKSRIAAERGFQYGVVNAVDVLNSVQNEYKNRRELLKSQYDFITSLLILERWAGTLSEKSIETANKWLMEN